MVYTFEISVSGRAKCKACHMPIQKGIVRAKQYNSMNTAFYHFQCLPMTAITSLRRERVVGRGGIPGAYDPALSEDDLYHIRARLHDGWAKIDEEAAQRKKRRRSPAYRLQLAQEQEATRQAFPTGCKGVVTVVGRDVFPRYVVNHFVEVVRTTARYLHLREFAKSREEVYIETGRPYTPWLRMMKVRADWCTQLQSPAIGESHRVSIKRARENNFGEQRRFHGSTRPVLVNYLFENQIIECDEHGAILHWEERAPLDTDAVQAVNLGGKHLAGMSRDEAEATDANVHTLVRLIELKVGTGSEITLVTPEGVQLRPSAQILPLLTDACLTLTALFAPIYTRHDAHGRACPLMSSYLDFTYGPNKAPVMSVNEAFDVDTC